MGQQSNKVQKRGRKNAYLKRKKELVKLKKTTTKKKTKA